MIEFDTQKYHLLQEQLKTVKINTLFARSVIERKVSGKIYVDNVESPSTFYILHKYGMGLLFGKSDNEIFNQQFADYAFNKTGQRKKNEWVQVYPEEWHDKLWRLFAEKLVKPSDIDNGLNRGIELNTRVNFKFNPEKYLDFKSKNIKREYQIIRTDENGFEQMKGSVIPAYFWDSADDFCKNGIGFSLFYKGKIATTAFSAFKFDHELELGMETIPEFMGKGFAQYACSALIDYCIEHNYEPIWACRLENIPSYNLAQKLGFIPTLKLPYYRLIN